MNKVRRQFAVLLMLAPLVLLASPVLAEPAKVVPVAEFNLADYRGEFVYLDFWASWCTPCRASFPFMNELQRSQPDLKVVAVGVDSDAAAAQKFLRKMQPEFLVVFDPKGTLAKQYKLPGMPTSFLIDPNGELSFSHKGFRKKDAPALRKRITAAMSEFKRADYGVAND